MHRVIVSRLGIVESRLVVLLVSGVLLPDVIIYQVHMVAASSSALTLRLADLITESLVIVP